MNQCPEATALQAWEAVPLTPTVNLSPCASWCLTVPLFGRHVPARLVHQGAGGEALRLDGMKRPIIPPSRCQQAAVPQRKAAHFEQYHHFMPPPPHPPAAPYPVLEWRDVVALQRSSHSAAFVSADKAAQ